MDAAARAMDRAPGTTVEDAVEPLSFFCWNADGLTRKLKRDDGRPSRAAMALREAIAKRAPDVIALQEVWLKAAGGGKEGAGTRCGRDEWRARDERASDDGKRGRLTTTRVTMGRDHTKMSDEGKVYAEDKAVMEKMLGGYPFREYDAHFCLAGAKRYGTCVLVKKALKKPIRVARTLALDGTDASPDDIDTNEGRVLLLEYEKVIVLNTYVPHNGGNPERWEKRAMWDFRVKRFLTHYKGKKDVIWLGDLNCAHRDLDVAPSPEQFIGVGGFTVPERQRFTDILSTSDMVDAYRALHGDRQTFTWRGIGMGSGLAMRLDYFIVPRTFVHRLKSCETSTDRFDDAVARERPISCFFGSDHCALYLTLHKRDASDAEKPSETKAVKKDEADEEREPKRAKANEPIEVITLTP